MRNNLIGLFVIFSILSSQFTYAAEFVVRAAEADPIDFQAFVVAQGQPKSLAEWLYLQSPSEKENQALVAAFANAQSLFFQVEKDKALEGFEKIIQLRTQSDWREPQTQFFFTSALRAAELTGDEKKKQEHLILATSYKQQHAINKKIFAPPLVNQFESTKIDRVSALTPSSWQGFEILSINGERHNLRQNAVLSLPAGVHRATLYSSAFKTQSVVIKSSQLLHWNPERLAWVQGHCENFQLDENLKSHNPILYFSPKCFRETNSTALAKSMMLAPATKTPLTKQSEIPFASAAPPSAEVSPWWKNKWLWMGLAGAGAAYLIYENNQGGADSSRSGPVVYE